jgi:hypothetical protein
MGSKQKILTVEQQRPPVLVRLHTFYLTIFFILKKNQNYIFLPITESSKVVLVMSG